MRGGHQNRSHRPALGFLLSELSALRESGGRGRETDRLPDIYGALRILAHPNTDASNAFLMGFSHERVVAMKAGTVWASDVYARADPVHFRAFFPFHPYCIPAIPNAKTLRRRYEFM